MTIDDQIALLKRGTTEIISEADLKKKLQEGRPLRIKLGVDPTARDVTLGWAVVLRKLRDFQNLGHQAVLVIGDFTAMIGDPSGKSKTRKQLTKEEVETNVEAVKKQFGKILDIDKTEIRPNSEWLAKMNFEDVLRLCGKTTVARIMERDDFTKRWEAHQPIAMHELMYPLLQGTDSVALNADVELGGNDQKFNNLMGRQLQEASGQAPQCVVLSPLLVGTDGKEKMSQSLNNYVSIVEPANEMFGKTMSIPDELIENWFELCTDVPRSAYESLCQWSRDGIINPKDLKRILAAEIVKQYHPDEDVLEVDRRYQNRLEIQIPGIGKFGKAVLGHTAGISLGPNSIGMTTSGMALSADMYFVETFSKRQQPVEVEEAKIPEGLGDPVPLANLIAELGMAKSNGAARDLIKQGGVSLDSEKVTDPFAKLPQADLRGKVLKVGKHQFRKLI